MRNKREIYREFRILVPIEITTTSMTFCVEYEYKRQNMNMCKKYLAYAFGNFA